MTVRPKAQKRKRKRRKKRRLIAKLFALDANTIMLISKTMTTQSGKQIIAIHILSNISRRKDNQTSKFGQLMEHNMRKIFLEKSYIKDGTETIPRPFSKKSKLDISPD